MKSFTQSAIFFIFGPSFTLLKFMTSTCLSRATMMVSLHRQTPVMMSTRASTMVGEFVAVAQSLVVHLRQLLHQLIVAFAAVCRRQGLVVFFASRWAPRNGSHGWAQRA
jgi:hypothetical protein